MSLDRNNLLRTAFDAYLLQLNGGELEPAENYLSYDFDGIDSHQWHALGNEMVKDELREITNNLNHWHGSLQRWQAWNTVIQPYGTDEAWELRREFLEALAHHCLLTPSSIRDTFTFVATNSMHQVRLMASKGYRDYLEGDPKNPSEKPKHLTRRQKEKRLADLISIWSEAPGFMASLRKIDDEAYRNVTSDYRNRNSHSIGPRLGIGITRAVVRSVKQATMMSKQPDGTYVPAPISGKMSVSYGFGGTEPLDMEKARAANLDQYRRARECYAKYRGLLAVGLASMPPTR
jgi:hypothetical protein